MREAKNNYIMPHKIQLKWTFKKASIMFNKVAKQQIIIKKQKARGSWLTMTMKKWIFCTKTTYLKILKAKDQFASLAAKLWFTI